MSEVTPPTSPFYAGDVQARTEGTEAGMVRFGGVTISATDAAEGAGCGASVFSGGVVGDCAGSCRSVVAVGLASADGSAGGAAFPHATARMATRPIIGMVLRVLAKAKRI